LFELKNAKENLELHKKEVNDLKQEFKSASLVVFGLPEISYQDAAQPGSDDSGNNLMLGGYGCSTVQ